MANKFTDNISESREVTEELLTYLSEFFKQTNPDPFVAIAAIEIYKNQLFTESIFDIRVGYEDGYIHLDKTYINDEEIEEFLSILKEFINESSKKIKEKTIHPYPPATYIVTALEIVKYQFLEKSLKGT